MIKKYKEFYPKIHDSAFIADGALVMGNVTLEEGVSVWYNAVLRGDEDSIYIGKNTNIQDNSTIHIDIGLPLKIGENVTVGHNAIVHSCTIGNNSLIGMGSIVLDGSKIGNNSIVAAGALIPPNKVYPDGVMIMGSPGKAVRELTEEEKSNILRNANIYVELAKEHKEGDMAWIFSINCKENLANMLLAI